MNRRIFPSEDVVLRGAAAAESILRRHGLDGRARHVARRVARVILREVYLGPEPPRLDPVAQPNPADLRWCHHCGCETEVYYEGVALRCKTCTFATSPRIKSIDVL